MKPKLTPKPMGKDPSGPVSSGTNMDAPTAIKIAHVVDSIQSFPPGLVCVRCPPQAVKAVAEIITGMAPELKPKGYTVFIFTGPLDFTSLTDNDLQKIGLKRLTHN